MSDEIHINKQDLKLLLEKRRDSIVKIHKQQIITNLLGVITVVSACLQFADNQKYFILFLIFGTLWIILTILNLLHNYNNKYSHEKLLNDIEGLGINEHQFNIMVIQNKSNGKVLTTKDKRCDMWLFPYKKSVSGKLGTKADQEENLSIKEYLSVLFNIPEDRINTSLRLTDYTRKYSVSDKIDKVYFHRYFKVTADDLNTDNDEFEINGTKYRWWSISDLEIDPKSVQYNSEIIATVKNEVL